MRDHDELFSALAKAKFRSQFRLRRTELRYLIEKGLATVVEQVDYAVGVIAAWLERQAASAIRAEYAEHGSSTATRAQESQRRPF
jgi:hypothetical protein